MLLPIRHILLIALISLLYLGQTLCCAATKSQAIPNIPEDSTKILPLAPEDSVSTFVPSVSAPGNGLAVNIIYPKKARYKDGAPIAVVIPGGDAPSGLNLSIHGAQAGFVEVRFSFPGGGIGTFKSGGFNDYRGIKSQRALRDILLFVAGKGEDFRHRTINNLVPIKISTKNIGIVGWSNGGNIALVTMEKYVSDLGFLRWLALYECPLGSLFFPPSLGNTHDFVSNNHYREGSAATGHCLIDFRKLAWQADAMQHPGIHKKLGEPDLPGVIYFDENKNGKWDETTEFAFNYCLDKGLKKQIYPPDVTSAMERLKIFSPTANLTTAPAPVQNSTQEPANKAISTPTSTSINTGATDTASKATPKPQVDRVDQVIDMLKAAVRYKTQIERTGFSGMTLNKNKAIPVVKKVQATEEKNVMSYWPHTIATLEESETYFQERDGSASIAAICDSYPNLLVTILAGQVDHLQTQPDHPHIVSQYNLWLDNNAHWIRLNPESIYLASLANMNKSNFAQNMPNSPIEATNINEYLEPAGALKDYVYADATIAELADRCQFKKYDSPLIEPLCQYSNGLSLPVKTEIENTKAKDSKK